MLNILHRRKLLLKACTTIYILVVFQILYDIGKHSSTSRNKRKRSSNALKQLSQHVNQIEKEFTFQLKIQKQEDNLIDYLHDDLDWLAKRNTPQPMMQPLTKQIKLDTKVAKSLLTSLEGTLLKDKPTKELNEYNEIVEQNSVANELTTTEPISTAKQTRLKKRAVKRGHNSKGCVNVYIYSDLCNDGDVTFMFMNALYPRHPLAAEFMTELKDEEPVEGMDIGRRILGYLHPPSTGEYIFQMKSWEGMEMILFQGSPWTDRSQLLRVFYGVIDRKAMKEQQTLLHQIGSYLLVSEPVHLSKGIKYYLEINTIARQGGKINVEWKLPDTREFITIGSEYLNPLHSNDSLHVRMPSETKLHRFDNMTERQERYKPLQFHRLPQVDHSHFPGTFPQCRYKPSYIPKDDFELFYGVPMVKMDVSYPLRPLDNTTNTPNDFLLDRKTAANITILFIEYLQKSRTSNYLSSLRVTDLVTIEQNLEETLGKRYLVEVDAVDQNHNKMRISRYVFQPRGHENLLCEPVGYQWQPNVNIYIVTPIKNQAKWFHYLVDSVADVQRITNDHNLHLIVSDCESNDTDVLGKLESSGIEYTYISETGRFNKVKSLNTAVKKVPQGSIVFTLDLHVTIPVHLFDQIRKHTMLGRTAYSPVLVRLYCGEYIGLTEAPYSQWVDLGYGMISMYKEDWDRVGGMNEKMFGEKWGGEDWELVDRLLRAQIEVIHQRLPDFTHNYHSTKGTWDGTKLF